MSTSFLHAAGLNVRRGIEYGHAGNSRLLLDAYVPEGRGPFPAVVIVHGGGWVRGDRHASVEPLFRPIADAGYAWFSISYRLAGEMGIFGAAIQDVEQAVQYIRSHAAEYRVDPARLALVGESAGAQLASMAALSPALKGAVKGVVAIYSPSDLVTLAKTSQYVPEQLRKAVEKKTAFAALFLAGLQRLSPVANVRADMPPFLFIHGTADHLVPFEQSEQMCRKMREVGAPCELFAVRGGGHGLHRWDHDKTLSAYKRVMVEWLGRAFNGPMRPESAPTHAGD
jgi:acetyl esterase